MLPGLPLPLPPFPSFHHKTPSSRPCAGPAAPAAAAVPDVTRMDIRVGRIVSCEKHPDADSLYVEQVGPLALQIGPMTPGTYIPALGAFHHPWCEARRCQRRSLPPTDRDGARSRLGRRGGPDSHAACAGAGAGWRCSLRRGTMHQGRAGLARPCRLTLASPRARAPSSAAWSSTSRWRPCRCVCGVGGWVGWGGAGPERVCAGHGVRLRDNRSAWGAKLVRCCGWVAALSGPASNCYEH